MRISVVIPCRNAERWIGRTLTTVWAQTRPADEVIVVDNGSTDASRRVAAGHAKGGRPLRLLTCGAPGAPAARNLGLAAATGDAVMFLDADDLLGPTVLAELATALGETAGGIAACPWQRYEEAGDGCWIAAPPSCTPRDPGWDDMAAWLRGWYHPPCSVLWSRAALETVGPWDEALTVNQDGDMMLRALALGVPLIRTDRGTAFYRRLPGDAVSQSGRRLTQAGVESRLRVLRNAVAMLRSKSMISRYLDHLAIAFGMVAESCRGEHPDLALSADAFARDPAGAALAAEPVRTSPARAPADQPLPIARTQNDPPLVSVVIPTYNRARLLRRALAGVFAQDWPRMEILVVDDASTDDTAAVVQAHGDPRIRYLRQPVNQGVAAARNRGMAEARGDFIALLDSDDEWLPGKITRQVEVFRAHPAAVGMVCTGLETVERGGGRTRWHPTHRGDIFRDMLVRNVLNGASSSALLRREAVEVVGGFDGSLPAIEDWDYWLRVTRFFAVAHADEVLTLYHDAESGDPEKDAQRRSRNFAADMDAREMLFRRYGHDLRRAGLEHRFLLDSAGRHRASPHGSGAAAMRLVLRAIRRRPLTMKQYGLLLPHRVQGPLQRIWHAVARPDGMSGATTSPAGPREDGR